MTWMMTARAMHAAMLWLAGAACVLLSGAARADAVDEWNQIALEMTATSSPSAGHALYTMATVHAAMFEALNFIEARYVQRYTVRPSGLQGASPNAAAATAAHDVLARIFPGQEQALKDRLQLSLDAMRDDRGSATGGIAGKSVAAIVWTARGDKTAAATQAPPTPSASPARDAPDDPVSRINPRAWNGVLVALGAATNLSTLERARLYAMVSLAAEEAYIEASRADARPGAARSAAPCAPCAVQAAVAIILEGQLNDMPRVDGRAIGAAIGRRVFLEYYTPAP